MTIRWEVSTVRPIAGQPAPPKSGFGFTIEPVNPARSFSLVFDSEERANEVRDFVEKALRGAGGVLVD
jgi:hypothetical protein